MDNPLERKRQPLQIDRDHFKMLAAELLDEDDGIGEEGLKALYNLGTLLGMEEEVARLKSLVEIGMGRCFIPEESLDEWKALRWKYWKHPNPLKVK